MSNSRRKRFERYRSPDGLDWRDPNMPVYMPTPSGTMLMPPDVVQGFFHYQAFPYMEGIQTWRDDPTYNLRRKK